MTGRAQCRRDDRRRLLAGMLAGPLGFAVGPADDAPSLPPPHPAAYELIWSAPDGCPTQAEIVAAVDARLDEPGGGHGVARLTGVVSPTEHGFELDLQTEFAGATERRRMVATRCDELGDATSLIIAVALQPNSSAVPTDADVPARGEGVTARAAEAAPERAEVARATRVPEDVPAPAARAQTESGRAGASGLRGLVEIGAGFEWGALSAATANLRLAAGITWPRFSIKAHGTYLTPRTLRQEDGTGGRYQLGAAGLRGCGHFRRGRFEFPLCAGLEGGALRVDTRGLEPSGRRIGPWLGPLASAGLRYHWSTVALFADTELVGRAVGSATRIDGRRSVEQFFLSLRALGGVAIFFP